MTDTDQQHVYKSATAMNRWLARDVPRAIAMQKVACVLVSQKTIRFP